MRPQSKPAFAAAVLAVISITAQAQGNKTFRARLSPVPIDLTLAGSITGSGSVTAVLTDSKLTFNGNFEGLTSPATIAQLRKGPVAGVRGPVLFDLTITHGTSGTIGGSVELTPPQVTDLEKRRLYVQIHSEKSPDGNLWGWLFPQENKR